MPKTEGIVADRKLYLTRDNPPKLVEEGSLEAGYLLATPGTEIPAAEVERLGLKLNGKKVVQEGWKKLEPGDEVIPRTRVAVTTEAPTLKDNEVSVEDTAGLGPDDIKQPASAEKKGAAAATPTPRKPKGK